MSDTTTAEINNLPVRSVFTVTEVNEYIKTLIETSSHLNNIFIKGEISNFVNQYKTGHFYFTIKDENSVLRAVMFKGSTSKLKFVPKNGMKIIASGRISLYTKDGQYQVYCDDLEPDGIGSLYIAFEQLKDNLEKEGLFDKRRKKPIPKIPTAIGIITSPTGAAIRDMINVITRRFKHSKIVLFPSLVQGENAPSQLISGVKYFNRVKTVDTIIIGRGGGSIEELWAFNDEKLARSISASVIPVVSAVGHETDFTISDFVADMRVPTPSAAAELVVPDEADIKQYVKNIRKRLYLCEMNRIIKYRNKLEDYKGKNLTNKMQRKIDDQRMNLLFVQQRLDSSMNLIINSRKSKFENMLDRLNGLNPLLILSRGYSIPLDNKRNVIKTVEDVKKGDNINIRLSDGEIKATIDEVNATKKTEEI